VDVPVVTVIIPVFNAERFVAEALDSVRRQDYEPLDVLVVDDGSTRVPASLPRLAVSGPPCGC
jgi:cellulose synthase/poly-beta-1,6-N-acetylglucosamine synthase-like glycosyltransferase